MTLRHITWIVLAALLMFTGAAVAEWWDEDVVEREVVTTVVRAVAPPEYREILRDYGLEPGGLRGFIEGIEQREPEVITIVDTLPAPPPDTVYGPTLRVDASGRLTFELLTAVGDSALYARQIRERTRVTDCDEGFAIQGGTVVCDVARFGHLYATPRAGLRSVAPGLDWEPSYRSPWQLSASYVIPYDPDERPRLDVWVSRRVRIW